MEEKVSDEDVAQELGSDVKVSSINPTTPSSTLSHTSTSSGVSKWRNIAGFWLLGLLSNYPFVIMLAAAFDIIHSIEGGGALGKQNSTDVTTSSCTLVRNEISNVSSYPPRELCLRQGTSVILLASILPNLVITLTIPYFMNFIPYWIRVLGIITFSLASFVLVAVSTIEALVILGVVCASVAAGSGEVVFLSLTARYHKSTLSAWASGSGGAGVAGALMYAVLKTFFSPIVTLLVQLFVPVLMFLTYFFLLGPMESNHNANGHDSTEERASMQNNSVVIDLHVHNIEETDIEDKKLEEMAELKISQDTGGTTRSPMQRWWSLWRKNDGSRPSVKERNKVGAKFWLSHVKYIPHLFKYMIPLFLVYFAEYAINQGFFELLYNTNTHIGAYCLDQKTQYRWLQVMYRVGALVSRSSVSVIHIKYFWILSLLQLLNFVFFFISTIFLFLPSFWLTFFLVFYEGLLGGGAYVNAFYTITKEVPPLHREFSMGVASAADSTGICVAGLCSFFIHKYICGNFIGFLGNS